MKKSTLALSIAAALGGMGMAGNALAVVSFSTTQAGNTASALQRNDNGIGHQLVFPYFTAQGDNATMLAITNTDTVNGKLVKVRFRGAANSDDLFDFQVALSPGDVWTAAVTKDAETGKAKLSTSDTSCTIPYNKDLNGATFNTFRVDPSAADVAGQTREGYVEVINMADIKPVEAGATGTSANALFTAIKHVKGVAPCTASVLEARLGVDNAYTTLTSTAVGLSNPTSGLTGDWIIMNQTSVAAWSGSATALEAVTVAAGVATPAAAALVFWPQTAATPAGVTAADAGVASYETIVNGLTADPLLTSGIVPILNFDLPDLSTPYVGAETEAAARADDTTAKLAVKTIANQYVTTPGINAVTDLVFSQPMRRYSAAVNYKAFTTTSNLGVVTLYPFNKTGSVATPIYRGSFGLATDAAAVGNAGTGSTYYSSTNLSIPTGGRDLCLNNVSISKIYDREETTPASGSASAAFVISPNPAPSTPDAVRVCGEAAVVTMNDTGNSALSASIAVSKIKSSTLSAYNEGWVRFDLQAGGLPILGASFIRANNGTNNYGFSWSHKVTR